MGQPISIQSPEIYPHFQYICNKDNKSIHQGKESIFNPRCRNNGTYTWEKEEPWYLPHITHRN